MPTSDPAALPAPAPQSAAGGAQPAGGSQVTPPPAGARPRRSRWRLVWGGLGLVLLLMVGLAVWRQTAGAPPPPTPSPTPGPRYAARGAIRPVEQARVSSAGGGSVSSLSVRDGDSVQSHQELARISGPAGTEVLVAPWAGTVTAVAVDRGDSVSPGSAVVTLGDLSRLRVETTDVDEYLVGEVRRGQPVLVRVDALDGRTLQGYVRSVALEPRTGASGVEHYPVVIDLVTIPPELRVRMSVRVAFDRPGQEAGPGATVAPVPRG